MHIIKEPNLWRAHGDSTADVTEWLRATPKTWLGNFCEKTDGSYGARSWTLGHNQAEVMRLARDGWPEGVQQLNLSLNPRPNSRVNAWRYDMAGEMPDVPRFIAGSPAHMRRRGHETAHRPVVSLYLNNWINAGISAQQMVNYGAAMVAAIDRIETGGRRVEVIVGTAARQCRNQKIVMSASWTVKRAEDHIDLSALAFSLAHPGASRRFGWAMWERSGMPDDSAGYGMVMGWDVTPEMLIDPQPGLIIMRGMNGAFSRSATFEDALRTVAEQINSAAGEELLNVEDLDA